MGRPKSGRVTVRAIADEAGVSIATVSRVLNGAVPVSAETAELVRQAAARLGAPPPRPAPVRRPARPDAARSATGSGLPGTGFATTAAAGAVYVRCPYRLTDYFGVIVTSIAETLALHGRRMLLGAGESSQGAHVLGALAADPEVAGAVLILPPEPGEELDQLRAARFPFVVVDPRTALPREIAAVSAANTAAARSVTAHLTALGHRRIGVIGGPTSWLAGRDRLVGHVSALADTGTLADPALHRHIQPTTAHGYQAACELLDLPDRPTALVAFNDKMAVGALRAAQERGLRVPEDLSVTGFDDSDLSRCTLPALTTVRQPLEEMGRLAVSLLTRILEGHTVDTLHIELATDLVVRGSTGPAAEPGSDSPARFV